MLNFPPFRLDLDEERLWQGERLLAVRRKPMAILRYLVAHPRRLVTHAELLAHVWAGATVSESAVRSHLHDLRSLLGEGVIETVVGRGYRFIAELAADEAPAAPAARTASTVGRTAELATLRAAFDRALAGQRQVCLVIGEPGIGKSTLVSTLVDELEDRGDTLVATGTCLEQQSAPDPYSPVIELLLRLARSHHGRDVAAALVRHAPTFVAQVPQVVPDADVQQRARGATESRMVRELLEAIEAIAAQHPLVLVLEDLQWSDTATLDLLAALGQRRERARMLVIATARRAEAQTVAHPFNHVRRTLVARAGATALALDRIAVADIDRLIARRFPDHDLPAAFAAALDQITAGMPLFLVAMLDDLAARGMVEQRAGRWQLTATLDTIAAHRPDSLTQLIDLQLDRLTGPEQRALEAASMIGLELSSELVAAAVEAPVEDTEELCDGLARRGLFLRREPSAEWPDGTLQTRYSITHGLVREVCAGRANPARRRRWHRAIAERLEAAHGSRAGEVAHVLALHFDQAVQTERAIHYYRIAADQAAQRFAVQDALRLVRRAQELLARLPADAARDQLELPIVAAIGSLLMRTTEGLANEPIALFEDTVALARRLDHQPQLYRALALLCLRALQRADYARAQAVEVELVALAEQPGFDRALAIHGALPRALGAMHRGELAAARALFEAMLAAVGAPVGPKSQLHTATVRAHYGVVCCLLGDRELALREARAAVEVAREIGEPFALGIASTGLARVQLLRGDPLGELGETAERALAVSEPGMSLWSRDEATMVAALCRAEPLGEAEADELIARFRARWATFPMGITMVALPLIAALRRAGRLGDARGLAEEMLAFGAERGEHWVDDALRAAVT